MAHEYNVGDLVAEFLQQAGIDTVFGIVSVHNIPMLDAIGRRNAIRFVMCRGEMGGGHMADAFARVRDHLGVVVTSTGPGASNVVAGLVEARFAGSPVLHLTGQTATGNIDKEQGTVHDVPDQLGMLKSVSKAAYRVRRAENALGVLMQAAIEALTPPRGPVSVEIPIDIQRTPIARPEMLDHLVIEPPAADPGNATQLDQLAGAMAGAKRPMLWIGTGAKHARSAVERLAAMGVAVVTSVNGRGVLPEDHPMTLGAFNNVPLVEKLYGTVDFMLVAGGRLRGHETRDLTLKLPARRAQIDIDPGAAGRTYPTDLFVRGEAAAALSALADRLDGKLEVESGWRDEVAKLKADVTEAYRETLGPYRSFPEQVRAALPKDGLWVRDVTLSNTTWGNRLFPLYDPRDSVYPVGAAIGPGMQLGIGAAIAAPARKTLVMTGDGGFFLNVGELWTAAQERANLCIMVMNDRGYGVIKHIQDALYGGRHFFGDLLAPDLGKLAELAGMPFWKIREAGAVEATLKEALAVDGPTLVEVDMNAIGPFPRYFAPPPYAQKKE